MPHCCTPRQTVPAQAPFPATFAGVHPNFIAFLGQRSSAFANLQNFSHEIGHFVGLYHTQLTWGNSLGSCPNGNPDTCTITDVDNQVAALQAAQIAATGSVVGALDGDLLSDTAEDPGPYYWSKRGVSRPIRPSPRSRFRSPIHPPSGGAVQPVLLGFAGSSLIVEETFNGTLIAPNASVSLGIGSGRTFTGAFYARTIEVRPQSVLVCESSEAAPL